MKFRTSSYLMLSAALSAIALGSQAFASKATPEIYSATEQSSVDATDFVGPKALPAAAPKSAKKEKPKKARSHAASLPTAAPSPREINELPGTPVPTITRAQAAGRLARPKAEKPAAKLVTAPPSAAVPAAAVPAPASKTAFDPVASDQIDSIASRLKLVEKLIREHGRAYDYRTLTTRELREIVTRLDFIDQPPSMSQPPKAKAADPEPVLEAPAMEAAPNDAGPYFEPTPPMPDPVEDSSEPAV